jgi:hypothetical protein
VGHPRNSLTAILVVARKQGRLPAAIFFPLGYPTPYEPARRMENMMWRLDKTFGEFHDQGGNVEN